MTAGREAAPSPTDRAAVPAPPAGSVTIGAVSGPEMAGLIDDLGEILADAVQSGSGVNFVLPFSAADGAAWWRSRLPDVASGAVTLLVARLDGAIVGTTLVIPSRNPNAPHRAEIGKVIVHRRARGRGIGSALMAAAEQVALADGRWLLVLDTFAGSDADRLYRRLGWQEVGTIPDHSQTPDGVLGAATIFRKDLRGARPG